MLTDTYILLEQGWVGHLRAIFACWSPFLQHDFSGKISWEVRLNVCFISNSWEVIISSSISKLKSFNTQSPNFCEPNLVKELSVHQLSISMHQSWKRRWFNLVLSRVMATHEKSRKERGKKSIVNGCRGVCKGAGKRLQLGEVGKTWWRNCKRVNFPFWCINKWSWCISFQAWFVSL